MGFLGALGKAFKAPVNAVKKLPGMGSVGKVVGSVPGVNPMMNKIGLGPSPAAQNNGLMQGAAGIAAKMRTPPMMPTPPLNQSLSQTPDQPTNPMVTSYGADQSNEGPAPVRPDVMPQTGGEVPLEGQANLQQQMAQTPGVMNRPGLGPRPPMMGQMMRNRPQFGGRRMM